MATRYYILVGGILSISYFARSTTTTNHRMLKTLKRRTRLCTFRSSNRHLSASLEVSSPRTARQVRPWLATCAPIYTQQHANRLQYHAEGEGGKKLRRAASQTCESSAGSQVSVRKKMRRNLDNILQTFSLTLPQEQSAATISSGPETYREDNGLAAFASVRRIILCTLHTAVLLCAVHVLLEMMMICSWSFPC